MPLVRKVLDKIMILIVMPLLVPVLVTSAASPHRGSGTSKSLRSVECMPSLFSPEEAQYDRYAACWAATEGLRRIRDKALSEFGDLESSDGKKRIHARFVSQSGDVLHALGMSVSQFNQLGRQISRNKALKEKVLEQAYLYRMAATLNMDRVPLIEDAEMEELERKKRVEMFCESVSEIEKLRSNQIRKLKKSLQVDRLPDNIKISDPSVLPLLSPKVRAVVEAFPLQAEEIVKKYGLHSDEFNEMMRRKQSNPVFRWKVEKYLKERDPKGSASSKRSGL